MADIFREVDEELRQERVAKLWRAYGNYVVAAAVVIVLATAGYTFWKDWRATQRQEAAARLAETLAAAEGEPARTADALGLFAAEAGDGYAVLARLHQAALLARAGRPEDARAIYAIVINDADVPESYRNLARVALVMNELERGEAAALSEQLQPLLAEGSPWRHVALELEALIRVRAGDLEAARASLKRLVDDAAAPAALRGRASELLAAIGQG